MQSDPRTFPDSGFVRLPQILAVLPISKSSWWAGVKAGKYPASVKHGRCTFWQAEDIHALLAEIAVKSRQNNETAD